MDDIPSYDELAQEFIDEFTSIGRTLKPVVVNSVRGETAVLMSLFRAEGELSPGELGQRAHVSSARIANILRALEEKGLVTRSHSAADRRQVAVSLTAEGRAEAAQVRADRTSAVECFLRELGEEDATELMRIARRTRDILEDHLAREGAKA